MIAKFRYHIAIIAKITMHSEIFATANFRYDSEIFAMIAKFSYHSEFSLS